MENRPHPFSPDMIPPEYTQSGTLPNYDPTQPTFTQMPQPLNPSRYNTLPPLLEADDDELPPLPTMAIPPQFTGMQTQNIQPGEEERRQRKQAYEDAAYQAALTATSRSERDRLMQQVEEEFLAGPQPTQEAARVAHNIVTGAYAPKGVFEPVSPAAALKKNIAKKGENRVTSVELPNGKFVRAGRLRNSARGTELVEISTYPEAGIRRKNGTEGYMAELYMDPADAGNVPDVAARRQHRQAQESIFQQEGHLWLRRERGYIADLGTAQARYNGAMQRVTAASERRKTEAVNAFNASELPMLDRLALIDRVGQAVASGAANARATLDQHASNVRTTVHNMTQVAEGALQQHELEAVNEAHRYIDDIAAQIAANRRRGHSWSGPIIKEALNNLLPNGEVYTNERELVVRAALNEHILNIAGNLARGGDTRQAHEMLNYFQRIGIVHKNARSAMSVVVDQEYARFIARQQERRTVPGSSDLSYLDYRGMPRRTVVRLPRNRRAFENGNTYAAASINVDEKVMQQIVNIQNRRD